MFHRQVEIVQTPAMLRPEQVTGRAVVVIDLLRATTTIAAALAAGAAYVEAHRSADAARAAAGDGILLAGERGCVRIAEFDFGNSPREFTEESVAGRPVLLTTTNGTIALAAAAEAEVLFAGALVNAAATAKALRAGDYDVTLLCAGTDGEPAPEDDAAARVIRAKLFHEPSPEVASVVRGSRGARNLESVGLGEDLEACLVVDRFNTAVRAERVGEVLRLSNFVAD